MLHDLWAAYGQRPGQVLYYAALDGALGIDGPARLALAGATVLLEVGCLYMLLRQLGLAARHALAIAALVLAFPFSDSVWLWDVLSLNSLAIAAYLLGVSLALRALDSDRSRARMLAGASLALYVASVASYELVAVAACLTGLLYRHRVGLRRARLRWALDVLAVAVTLLVTRGLLPVDVATPSRVQSLPGMLAHAGLIGGSGLRLAGASALPVTGLDPWIGAGAVAAVLLGAFVLRAASRPGDELRGELGRWLAIAAAGALVAVAAWSVYVPAGDHYLPSAQGTVNRVNAGAAIGIVMLVYAAAVLLASMLGRLARLPRSLRSAVLVALTLALLASYLHRAGADMRAWDTAAADQRRELADLHAALPSPRAGSTVFAYDAPAAVPPGIPVLGTTLDLTSALRLSYQRRGLVGVPVSGAEMVSCGAVGPAAAGVSGAYGRSYLVDVDRRRAVALTGARRCAARVAVSTVRTVRPRGHRAAVARSARGTASGLPPTAAPDA